MQQRLERIVEQFGAESGTIHLIEDGVLILKAHVGITPFVVQIVSEVALGKGMAGLASGRVNPGAPVTGLSGALVVPIRDRRGSARGALGIAVTRRHTFSDADEQRLLAEGEQLVR